MLCYAMSPQFLKPVLMQMRAYYCIYITFI